MKGRYIFIKDVRKESEKIFIWTQNEISGWCHTEDTKMQFHEILTVEEIGQFLGGN